MNTSDIAFAVSGDLHRNIRALKQLRSLAEGGYSVKVFHLGGGAQKSSLPHGVTEEIVPCPPGRGFPYFSRLEASFRKALQLHTARLYHASDLYTLAASASAAEEHQGLYSFDSRELYAHVAPTKGRPWVRWWWARLERKLLPGCACIFTVSDSIAAYLSDEYRIGRPIVVHNVPEIRKSSPKPVGTEPLQTMQVVLDDREFASNVPIVVHLGQMKKDRGCEQLVRAMEQVTNAHLVFLGYGPLEYPLKKLVSSKHLNGRVHFLPPVGPREVQVALSGSAIGVTMLQDTCLNHRFALPNKLFDYIHAGIPVLSSNLEEVANVVTHHNLGQTVDPNDHLAIAAAISDMVDHPDRSTWSKNARSAAETFSWENASQLFMLEINRVLSSANS